MVRRCGRSSSSSKDFLEAGYAGSYTQFELCPNIDLGADEETKCRTILALDGAAAGAGLRASVERAGPGKLRLREQPGAGQYGLRLFCFPDRRPHIALRLAFFDWRRGLQHCLLTPEPHHSTT